MDIMMKGLKSWWHHELEPNPRLIEVGPDEEL